MHVCVTHTCIGLVSLFAIFCFLCRTFAAHIIVQFTLKLLNKALPSLTESDASFALCGAFIFVCRQMYNTYEGLQVLQTYGLHKAIAAAWKKVQLLQSFKQLQRWFGYNVPFIEIQEFPLNYLEVFISWNLITLNPESFLCHLSFTSIMLIVFRSNKSSNLHFEGLLVKEKRKKSILKADP